MIIGASHITLGCVNLDAAIAHLGTYGYRPDFIDRNVPNNRSKWPVLNAKCEAHSIGLLRSAAGFPIELVHYRNEALEGLGRYVGVFGTERSFAGQREMGLGGFSLEMPSELLLRWEIGSIGHMDAPAFFVRNASARAGLSQVVLPVSNLQASRQLWCDVLGFCLHTEATEFAELRFASPVAAWRLALILVASSPAETRPKLDAKGMTCLSLLSSNVDDDVRSVISGGAQLVTDIFTIKINGRDLKVAILMDEDGAFIELLQIVR